MKKLKLIYLVFSVAYVRSTFTGGEPPEFIFSMNVPMYVPFKTTLTGPDGDENFLKLANAELQYIKAKERVYSKILNNQGNPKAIKNAAINDKDYSSDDEYLISSGKWRGALKQYKYDSNKIGQKNEIDTEIKDKINEENLNKSVDGNAISKLIDLFVKESFGSTDKESEEMFHDRAVLTILANRPKSVLSVKNRSLKRLCYDSSAVRNHDKAVIITGTWEPKWQVSKDKDPKSKAKNPKNKNVDFEAVRKYVRYCLNKWKDPSVKDKEKWKSKVIAILEQETVMNGIPVSESTVYYVEDHLKRSKDSNKNVRANKVLKILACNGQYNNVSNQLRSHLEKWTSKTEAKEKKEFENSLDTILNQARVNVPRLRIMKHYLTDWFNAKNNTKQ
ncbi:MAG: hypothetical protein H6845_01515 [Alphaproteobacteria bacterium]|nr:MAG: hypothetical protein H6845_01515 [Alphaproteobacteria bacterium]